MQIGVVGLGRMGGNIVRRLIRHGHQAVVHDRDRNAMKALTAKGAIGADGIDGLVQKLQSPRAIWVMLPAGEITETTVRDLGDRLQPGDIIIDGGIFARFRSRQGHTFAEKILSAMRKGFGGHIEPDGQHKVAQP